MESRIAAALYAIPAVKGVEFGAGFSIAEMRGSQANDPIRIEDGRIFTETNNAGGLNGGLTNGMPLVVRCAFRPTPSISREQRTGSTSSGRKTPRCASRAGTTPASYRARSRSSRAWLPCVSSTASPAA